LGSSKHTHRYQAPHSLRRPEWERLSYFAEAFARIRGKRGDVNQSDKVRLISGLRDDGAAVRMPDEQERPPLLLVRPSISPPAGAHSGGRAPRPHPFGMGGKCREIRADA
jgi:hypothetical protein